MFQNLHIPHESKDSFLLSYVGTTERGLEVNIGTQSLDGERAYVAIREWVSGSNTRELIADSLDSLLTALNQEIAPRGDSLTLSPKERKQIETRLSVDDEVFFRSARF